MSGGVLVNDRVLDACTVPYEVDLQHAVKMKVA